ncbi:Hsp20/alpha crystallin family protein [Candidatus Pacearchaeota archaeon]|nr:MAG: Hsp20/alpha crystallin family protein [Candidatus Pacearchaeota archaeon]
MAWESPIWREMRRMQRQIDRLMENFTRPWNLSRPRELELETPSNTLRRAWTDIEENDNEIVLKVELPGMNKDDIKVELEDDAIAIKAIKKQETKKEDKDAYFHSKTYAGFYRRIALPAEADTENIDAEYKNGVLTLRIPKKKTSPKKEIKIN